jgi:Rps23 Pro-64 3,4-dihydroxylase Tpa1-like proline 4-hydroxylase
MSNLLNDFQTSSAATKSPERDHLIIRGQRLHLDELLALNLASPKLIAEQRAAFQHAKPFEHIIIEGLFNENLLNLIEEEFPPWNAQRWTNVTSKHESTYRSNSVASLGSAAQIYFNLINSNRFVQYLSSVTGVEDLITDHALLGGGLHEARSGDWFAVHRDFNFHHRTMLANSLVFLTYLNRNWKTEYDGALELWDCALNRKITEIEPVFGRSILFRHSNKSFHGHPAPLKPPQGQSRRSLGAYYYVNDLAKYRQFGWRSSLFLDEVNCGSQSRWLRARHRLAGIRVVDVGREVKYLVRGMTPPLLWSAARSIYHSVRGKRP